MIGTTELKYVKHFQGVQNAIEMLTWMITSLQKEEKRISHPFCAKQTGAASKWPFALATPFACPVLLSVGSVLPAVSERERERVSLTHSLAAGTKNSSDGSLATGSWI